MIEMGLDRETRLKEYGLGEVWSGNSPGDKDKSPKISI